MLFCWHKWAKWCPPKMINKIDNLDGVQYECKVTVQDRTCEKCGKYEIKTLEMK